MFSSTSQYNLQQGCQSPPPKTSLYSKSSLHRSLTTARLSGKHLSSCIAHLRPLVALLDPLSFAVCRRRLYPRPTSLCPTRRFLHNLSLSLDYSCFYPSSSTISSYQDQVPFYPTSHQIASYARLMLPKLTARIPRQHCLTNTTSSFTSKPIILVRRIHRNQHKKTEQSRPLEYSKSLSSPTT